MNRIKSIVIDSFSVGREVEHISKSSNDVSTIKSLDKANNPRQRIVQNFVLIWLDPNINQSDDDYHYLITQLQRIVNTIETFNDPNQSIDFLTDLKDEKVFMIVSGTLAEHIVPLIHDIDQLHTLYILSDNPSKHKQWADKWWKVKGIHPQMELICDAVKQATKRYDQDSLPLSFLAIDDDVSYSNVDQLDSVFMYTQILKEILLEIKYNQQSINEFATYCRNGKYAEMNTINIFERDYRSHEPIWWYTCEVYLYTMLNRALRTLDSDILIQMGFFLCDLHRNIEQLHTEQFHNHTHPPFTVYRGQGLSKVDFEKLVKTKGGLMSFNNFLSTSFDHDVSYTFADSNRSNPDSMGVLFTIAIDPSISSVPFACIDNLSNFSDEKELLFSMHTIFRIGEIKKLDDTDRFWQIELKLTNDDDEQLRILTNRIRKETAGTKGWVRLGVLLMKIGESNKAEEVYKVLLNQTFDELEKGAIYNQLGLIKEQQGEYEEATLFCEKSLEIVGKHDPTNQADLATVYGNVALVYNSIGKYTEALSLFKKTLAIRQKVLSLNDSHLATSHNNIGMIYYNMGEYAKALSSYKKAQEIFEEALPDNHPDFALSYNNIACAYKSLGEYPKALLFHKKALNIRQKVLPPNHPNFPVSYINIASIHEAMGDVSQALLFHEKAREIYSNALQPNHPSLATSYNNIASLYHTMGEYSKALASYEKALEIFKKVLSHDHLNLANCYNNIGTLYHTIGQYSKALSFQEKAHEIFIKNFPSNHPLLATSYNNIASMYNRIGDYSKALASHEKALEIRQITLPPNHPDLATSYNNIATIYYEMGDHRKALPLYERALGILQHSVPPTHPNLLTVQEIIDFLKKKF